MDCKDIINHIEFYKYYAIDSKEDWLKEFRSKKNFPIDFLDLFFPEFIKFRLIEDLCIFQKLTEDFIFKHLDDIKKYWGHETFSWSMILEYQPHIFKLQTLRKITDEFIEDNKLSKDYRYTRFWYALSAFQDLNESFISDYLHYLKTYEAGPWLYQAQTLTDEFQMHNPWIYQQYQKKYSYR